MFAKCCVEMRGLACKFAKSCVEMRGLAWGHLCSKVAAETSKQAFQAPDSDF